MTLKNKKLKKFNVVLNLKETDQLDQIADLEEHSRSALLRLAVKKYLEEKCKTANIQLRC